VPQPTLVAVREPQHLVDARHVRWPAFCAETEGGRRRTAPAVFTPAPAESDGATASAATEAAVAGVEATYTTPVSEWAPEMVVSSRPYARATRGLARRPAGRRRASSVARLKKTKDSLVKTGAVTSASLGTAVRGVSAPSRKSRHSRSPGS
jgi:hypothetical protein